MNINNQNILIDWVGEQIEIIQKENKEKNYTFGDLFLSIIYDENKDKANSNNVYTDEHIKQEFTEEEKSKLTGSKDKEIFYVYIGICGHGKIIEVGKSQFSLKNKNHGDWVYKVSLRNSNVLFMNHVIGNLVDELGGSFSKEKVKEKLKGENIIDELNKDYKYIVFIPVKESVSSSLETDLQKHLNGSKFYLDTK